MTEQAWKTASEHKQKTPQQDAKWNGHGREARFSDMVGYQQLIAAHIGIYGVGAIGRQVALTLATMGCKKLTLVDPDIVEGQNFGTQGYQEASFKKLKVEETGKDCLARNSKMNITKVVGMVGTKKRVTEKLYWKPTTPLDVVVICVDDMISRKEISKSKPVLPTHLLVDTRMGAFAARVIADVPPFEHWQKTLFADSAAFTGRCTLQSTFFSANTCAGMAVSALGQYFAAVASKEGKGDHRGAAFEPVDFIIDMLDFDITHTDRENPEMQTLKLLEGNLQVINLGGTRIGGGGVAWSMADLLKKARAEAVAKGEELEPIEIEIKDDWHGGAQTVKDDGKKIQPTTRNWVD